MYHTTATSFPSSMTLSYASLLPSSGQSVPVSFSELGRRSGTSPERSGSNAVAASEAPFEVAPSLNRVRSLHGLVYLEDGDSELSRCSGSTQVCNEAC